MNLELGKQENLIPVSVETLGGGKVLKSANQAINASISETLIMQKMGLLEDKPIKITIEITVKALEDEEGYEIKGKVKKTIPSSSCTSIAVGDEFGLFVRKDGREGNPLQESLDYHGENEILGAKKNKKTVNE